MAIHYSLNWEEHPDMEVTMKSYSRTFSRRQMPSFDATGKSCRAKWTGPSASMMEKMNAIHDGGEAVEVSAAVAAAGRIQVLDGSGVPAGLQAVRVGGVNVGVPSERTWGALVGALNAASDATGVLATGGAQVCAGLELVADEVGAAGDGIELDLGLNPSRAILSGPHLSGGSSGAAVHARAEFEVGDPVAAGSFSVGGRTIEFAAAPGAPSQSAIGCVLVSADTADAYVTVAGIEVQGGGDGLAARINALHIGVHARWVDDGVLVVECDEPGSYGNDLELSGRWHSASGASGYCVALGSHFEGGSDAGWLPAVQARAAIGVEGSAEADWDRAGTLRIWGLRVECGEGERLFEAVNRMTAEGAFGARGVIAEPPRVDEPIMTLHAARAGAWGNGIELSWVCGGADAGREFLSGFEGGSSEEASPGRTGGELAAALDAELSRDGVVVGVANPAAAGFVTVRLGRSVGLEADAGSPATGWLRNHGRPDYDIGLRINGVHIVGVDPYGGDLPSVWCAQINAADCGVVARLDEADSSLILLEAAEPGAAGDTITLEVGEEYRGTYEPSGATLTDGRDPRDMAGLASELSYATGYDVTAVEGGLLVRGDASGYFAVSGAIWEDSGHVYRVPVPVVRVENYEAGVVRVAALEAGASGNGVVLGLAGCMSSDGEAREVVLAGGVGSADARARGWVRFPLGTGREIGLRVAGRRVQLGHDNGTAAEWAAAVNALGVGVTARAVTFNDYALVLSAVTAGSGGNDLRVGLVGDGAGLDVWGMSGGADAVWEVDYSASSVLPEGLSLAPWTGGEKSGYCWEVSSTVRRLEGEVAELETTWAEVFWEMDDEKDEDEAEDEDKREEEAEDEQVGEDEENPEIDVETTAVLEPILSHPKARNYSEVQLEACHLYMMGRGMNHKFVLNGKTFRIGDVFPRDVIGQKIRAGITEYYVPHTVARKTWKSKQGKVHNVCEIGRTGGLPAAGQDRNWMCMGGGKNKRGTDTTCTETWELSSPGGWDRELYSGN